MSLIVEDGTGLANAESYVSVVQADAYFARLGVVDWAGFSVAEREIALRKATAYMDARYSFRGERLRYEQSLSWPRMGYGSEQVPELGLWPVRQVADACCELALIAARGQPFYVPAQTADVRSMSRATVGPITVEYATTTAPEGAVRFQFVDDMLRYLVTSRRGAFRVERAS